MPRSLAVSFATAVAPVGCWVAALASSARALPATCSQSGSTGTCVFSSTGAKQSFAQPAYANSFHVVAVGGTGGIGGGNGSTNGGAAGGNGDEVVGDLALTSGSTLYVEVGGNGGTGASSSRRGHSSPASVRRRNWASALGGPLLRFDPSSDLLRGLFWRRVRLARDRSQRPCRRHLLEPFTEADYGQEDPDRLCDENPRHSCSL